MPKTHITLLVGDAGVGKDTYYRYLRRTQRGVIRLAFADFLKIGATELAGWDGEKDEKGRRLLQVLGDVVREYDINRFVDIVAEHVKEFDKHDFTTHIVITDCRYDNEVLRLREMLPQSISIDIIKLERTFESSLSDRNKAHPSEAGISEWILQDYGAMVVDLDKEDLSV